MNITKTIEYRKWIAAKSRCFNPKNPSYANYGGRGIGMHLEWVQSFKSFLAYIGPCPDGHSLDRISNDGHYEPGNVRWANDSQQQNNRSNNRKVEINGTILTVAQWARAYGVPIGTIKRRISIGWDAKEAITTPRRNYPEHISHHAL